MKQGNEVEVRVVGLAGRKKARRSRVANSLKESFCIKKLIVESLNGLKEIFCIDHSKW